MSAALSSVGPRLRCGGIALLLLLIGLVPASPYLTSRAVGSGEAFNYSLALADAVSQMRAGILPPLVGQTPYAFNGRIHPLRNAPYMFYLGGMLDLLSGHRLTFWELQNFSLAFSLIGAAFACYFGLRWGTGCGRAWALALAAAYAWCPGLLVAAHAHDLFMTVHASPFLPLALGACARQAWKPARQNDLLLAAALAAAWLAHPPVALWTTAAAALVRMALFARQPSVRSAAGLAGAAVLFFALAGFAFVSAASVGHDLSLLAAGGAFKQDFARTVVANLREAFPAVLRPVSVQVRDLGNMQLGYAHWLLLGLAAAGLARGRWDGRKVAVLALVACSVILLLLCLPVPGLTYGLWVHLPPSVHLLTNIWPMQRLYLVAAALVVFAAALTPVEAVGRGVAAAGLVAGLAWTLAETRPFLAAGFALRASPAETAASHHAENIDLSPTSYAFFGMPLDFTSGTVDPALRLHVIDAPAGQIVTDYSQSFLDHARVVQTGIFRRVSATSEILTPTLTLQPGKHYLLDFDFRTEPLNLYLRFDGVRMARSYRLPDAGGLSGFGMGPGFGHRVELWTDLPRAEEITARLHYWLEAGRPMVDAVDFAGFTLREVDLGELPRLRSYLPLTATVDAPRDGLYLETFRSYLSGYQARVDDRTVAVARSPRGNVMVPIPAGGSEVEVRYVGSRLLRASFWVSAASWLGLGAGLLLSAARRHRSVPFVRVGPAPRRGRILRAGAVAIVLLAAGTLAWPGLPGARVHVGPVRIRYLLPVDQTGHNQPLLVTGRRGNRLIVFVNLVDAHHVRVGADGWGRLFETPPVAVDYNRIQELVVSASALYPPGDPQLRGARPDDMRAWRNRLQIDLNGANVLAVDLPPPPGESAETRFGENPFGGSFAERRFTGQILSTARLPLSPTVTLMAGQAIAIHGEVPPDLRRAPQPVLALAGRPGPALVYLRTESARTARVGWVDFNGQSSESPDLPWPAGAPFALEVQAGRRNAAGDAEALAIRAGSLVLAGTKGLHPLLYPLTGVIGRSLGPADPVKVQFAGAALHGEVTTVSPPPAPFGAYDLGLALPRNRPGRAEPLLVSGRAGAADLVYIVYADATHVRLGVDHWGGGGALSAPIPLDYAARHEIEISLGSLYPPAADPAWGGLPAAIRHDRRDQLRVRLDGAVVLDAPWAAYAAPAGDIVVGENRIGGSTCDPTFTGRIFWARRPPLAGD